MQCIKPNIFILGLFSQPNIKPSFVKQMQGVLQYHLPPFSPSDSVCLADEGVLAKGVANTIVYPLNPNRQHPQEDIWNIADSAVKLIANRGMERVGIDSRELIVGII